MYIIAGCNGAGKTTASYNALPEQLGCKEFVNADEIARGLSPFQPEAVSLQAGRIMLARIKELIAQGGTFAFETTLAAKSYRSTILKAQQKGYVVILIFFWLESVELAKARVKIRAQEGGHFIPEEVIERRYKKGLRNLFEVYLELCDKVKCFDNADNQPELIFSKEKNQDMLVVGHTKYNEIRNYL